MNRIKVGKMDNSIEIKESRLVNMNTETEEDKKFRLNVHLKIKDVVAKYDSKGIYYVILFDFKSKGYSLSVIGTPKGEHIIPIVGELQHIQDGITGSQG